MDPPNTQRTIHSI